VTPNVIAFYLRTLAIFLVMGAVIVPKHPTSKSVAACLACGLAIWLIT